MMQHNYFTLKPSLSFDACKIVWLIQIKVTCMDAFRYSQSKHSDSELEAGMQAPSLHIKMKALSKIIKPKP